MKALLILALAVVTGCGGPCTYEGCELPCDYHVHTACVRVLADPAPSLEAQAAAFHGVNQETDGVLFEIMTKVQIEIAWVNDVRGEQWGHPEWNAYAVAWDETSDGVEPHEYRLIFLDARENCASQAWTLAHELLHIYAVQTYDLHGHPEWLFGKGSPNERLEDRFREMGAEALGCPS